MICKSGLNWGCKRYTTLGIYCMIHTFIKHFFSLTHRHIGHIELYKVLIIKALYIILCVLCAYVLKKTISLLVTKDRLIH
jgi:hypothetical protein